jgi:hypothetical protein
VVALFTHLPNLFSDPAAPILSVGVHAWFLYTLVDGFRACRELHASD